MSNEVARVEEKTEDDENDETGGNQENADGATMKGGFAQNNFTGAGDFNQMQMMMAMQTGANNFGGFPMMGEFPTNATYNTCV